MNNSMVDGAFTNDDHRGKIELRNQKPKYQITSPTGELANTENVVLKVHYNIQPWVGALTWTPQINFWKWKKQVGGISKTFRFPALKAKKTTDEAKKQPPA